MKPFSVKGFSFSLRRVIAGMRASCSRGGAHYLCFLCFFFVRDSCRVVEGFALLVTDVNRDLSCLQDEIRPEIRPSNPSAFWARGCAVPCVLECDRKDERVRVRVRVFRLLFCWRFVLSLVTISIRRFVFCTSLTQLPIRYTIIAYDLPLRM